MNKMITFAAAAALLALVAFSGSAAQAAPTTLKQMMAKLTGARTYQATIKSTITLQSTAGQGRPNVIHSTEHVLYERPNKLSFDAQGLMGGFKLVSDGDTMYQYIGLSNQYTAKPAPASLINSVTGAASFGGDLARKGTTRLDGVPVIVFKGKVRGAAGPEQVTLYVGSADDLPYRVITVTQRMSGPQGGAFRMVNEQDFTGQSVNAPIPASAFRFTPPANATKVESLGGIGGAAGAGGGLTGLP